jgi:hypothetical protein
VRHSTVNPKLLLFVLGSILFLGGCARIISPLSVSQSVTLSGVVQLARVSGASLRIYALSGSGVKGELLAETTTGSNGEYSVQLKNYSGLVIVESAGGTYKDEASGEMTAGSSLAAVAETSAKVSAPITQGSSFRAPNDKHC